MTIKIVNSILYAGLISIVIISTVACEKDFENIGVALVDNNQFKTKDTIFEVLAINKNIDSSRVDGIPQYLLGVYNDDKFGLIKTSFISQLGLPTETAFGNNVSIDAVILDIPYYSTNLGKQTIENPDNGGVNDSVSVPNYKLDSIIGNQEINYQLSVYESGTFLNTIDPQDLTQNKKYYSDEQYIKKEQLYTGLFQPNNNDTVLYVNRNFLDDDINTIDDIDTVKTSIASPSIKIPLNKDFFKNNFIDQQSTGIFDSFDNFNNFFRGLIIEADGTDGSLMSLAMSDSKVTIYYTNDVLTDETDTDLNGDGDTTDINVSVRTKQSEEFLINGIRASQYIRDYSNSSINSRLLNPDKINGEDKLFIQGAAGSISVIELFKNINFEELRNKNWLINEANLTFYLDETSSKNVPQKLWLYRFDENSQILDAFSEAQVNGVGGTVNLDENGDPVSYKFRITDYISRVLNSNDPLPLDRLALKVFHSTVNT
jgi:hypothetical protein